MPLDPVDLARINEIEDNLGCGRGWGPDAYFDHNGGKVSLSQARGVWHLAKELIRIAKKEPASSE